MNDGQPQYQLSRFGAPVLGTSRLGLQFSDAPSLADGLSVADSAVRRVAQTWQQPWGEKQWVHNRYSELRVDFAHAGKPALSVVFRLYDAGLGFRFDVPADPRSEDAPF